MIMPHLIVAYNIIDEIIAKYIRELEYLLKKNPV